MKATLCKISNSILASSLLLASLAVLAAQTAYAVSEPMKVEIVGADSDKDSQELLPAFKKLLQGLAQRDINTIGECLSPEVILFYNHDLVYGKKAVLDHISKKVIGVDEGTVNSITVYHPFIKVKGDTAMVSFRATKDIGGSKPAKLESWCWEIFERKDNEWKILQFNSKWTPLKASK